MRSWELKGMEQPARLACYLVQGGIVQMGRLCGDAA